MHKISKYHDGGVPPGTFGRNNWIILRYADVLLMQSELLHDINPADNNKFNGINEVRARAGVPPLDFTTTTSADDFVTAMVNERAWEFCVEGQRRWDLIRLKRFQQVQESLGHTFDPNRLLFPIPQTEIDVNPNLTQNPGY